MKLLPILLINAALVVGGIAIYDQTRSEQANSALPVGGVDRVEFESLKALVESRLGRDEGGLAATGIDPRVMARLEALESKLAVPMPARAAVAGASDEGAGSEGGLALPKVEEGEKPAEEDVRRFRRMMEAAEALRREERERERLTTALAELDISLNAEQTDKLLGATRSYREKIGEVWSKAFSGGREPGADREAMREAARQGMEGLRDEFAVTIHKFLPTGHAQKIVENLNRLGGRGFGMGGATMRRGR